MDGSWKTSHDLQFGARDFRARGQLDVLGVRVGNLGGRSGQLGSSRSRSRRSRTGTRSKALHNRITFRQGIGVGTEGGLKSHDRAYPLVGLGRPANRRIERGGGRFGGSFLLVTSGNTTSADQVSRNRRDRWDLLRHIRFTRSLLARTTFGLAIHLALEPTISCQPKITSTERGTQAQHARTGPDVHHRLARDHVFGSGGHAGFAGMRSQVAPDALDRPFDSDALQVFGANADEAFPGSRASELGIVGDRGQVRGQGGDDVRPSRRGQSVLRHANIVERVGGVLGRGSRSGVRATRGGRRGLGGYTAPGRTRTSVFLFAAGFAVGSGVGEAREGVQEG